MILVFGTVCLDRVRRIPTWPKNGGYVEVESESVLLGGEAANTANALQAWQDAPTLVGNPLGVSLEANDIRALLQSKGLHALELLKQSASAEVVSTPVCDIYVSDEGERTMFGRGFSTLEHSAAADAIPWQSGGWFTAEPNMERLSREVVRSAIAKGMNVYLMDFIRPDDPVSDASFWQSSTDWAGVRNNTQRNVRWLKDWVRDKGCFSILSDGPNGFVAGSAEVPVRAYPPFPAPEIVDTTGAGDMFRAGMLHGLNAGWAVPDCLRFASAAGCLKCRSLGATTSVPTIREIEEHIAFNADVARQYEW
jgi:sugar/nucleoside kinase (ribokinase family)